MPIFIQGALQVPSTQAAWGHIFLFALIGTVLPIFLLLQGMKTLSANKASIISVLEPVAVLAVGALILEEEVSPLQCLGAAIILLSAMAVQFDKEISPKQEPLAHELTTAKSSRDC
jgi:drug/metabolite transporter (DMT)-like permease